MSDTELFAEGGGGDIPPGILKVFTSVYETADTYGIIDFTAHPFIYADLLIRIGYEPFPPIEQTSVWKLYNSRLILPGVIPYARYLVFTDASRVYRTFGPAFVEKLVKKQVLEFLESSWSTSNDPPHLMEITTSTNFQHFLEIRCKQLAVQMSVTILTHPFRVITVRYMASYVDQNPMFSDALSSLANSIKSNHGGIFTGLVPRLFADFIYAATSAILYLTAVEVLQFIDIQTYFTQQRLQTVDKVITFVSNYVASNYCTQFRTVSDLMIVNGTSLAVGNPPFTPIYEGWVNCWRTIRTDRLHKSTSYFQRIYQGPLTWSKGRLIATDHFGPTYFQGQTKIEIMPYLLREFYGPMLPRVS